MKKILTTILIFASLAASSQTLMKYGSSNGIASWYGKARYNAKPTYTTADSLAFQHRKEFLDSVAALRTALASAGGISGLTSGAILKATGSNSLGNSAFLQETGSGIGFGGAPSAYLDDYSDAIIRGSLLVGTSSFLGSSISGQFLQRAYDKINMVLRQQNSPIADALQVQSFGGGALAGIDGTGHIYGQFDSTTTAPGGAVYNDHGVLKIGPPGSGGNANSNVGSTFRLAIPNTNNIKTISGGPWISLDSATTNQLRVSVDTTTAVARFRQITGDSLAILRSSLDSIIVVDVTTTDNNPVEVWSVPFTPGADEMITITIQCNAQDIGGSVGGYGEERRQRFLHKASGSLTSFNGGTNYTIGQSSGGDHGGTLSTCGFTIGVDGLSGLIPTAIFTGETSKTIKATLTITVTRSPYAP